MALNRTIKVRITDITPWKDNLCKFTIQTTRKDWDMSSSFIDFCNKYSYYDTIYIEDPVKLVWIPVYY